MKDEEDFDFCTRSCCRHYFLQWYFLCRQWNTKSTGKIFSIQHHRQKSRKGKDGNKVDLWDSNGSESNGKSIMIPLGESPNGQLSQECLDAQDNGGVNKDYIDSDLYYEYSNLLANAPGPARLHWTVCDVDEPGFECPADFEITDRNALDGDAYISVPSDMLCNDDYIMFDVWIRVMGKPNQCLQITGWAQDFMDGNYYWFRSGTVYLSKKKGTTFEKINELFEVVYCSDPSNDGPPNGNRGTGTGCEVTPETMSVFNGAFQDYFWQFTNQGTKVVQVRLYERPDACQ